MIVVIVGNWSNSLPVGSNSSWDGIGGDSGGDDNRGDGGDVAGDKSRSGGDSTLKFS